MGLRSEYFRASSIIPDDVSSSGVEVMLNPPTIGEMEGGKKKSTHWPGLNENLVINEAVLLL